MERLGASQRSLDAVSPEATRTLFFNNTTSDYAGKARPPGAWTGNLHKLRERPPVCGWDGRRSAGASPGEAPGAERPKWSLTAYTQHFTERPVDGAGMDRELKMTFAAKGKGTMGLVPVRGNYESSYSASSAKARSGRPAAALDWDLGESNLATLISPGGADAAVAQLSLSMERHAGPPKDWQVSSQKFEPRHNLGTSPKAGDFFLPESHRQYAHPAVLAGGAASAKPKLGRASSAPLVSSLKVLADEEGPERAFRVAMMRSQYGHMVHHARW